MNLTKIAAVSLFLGSTLVLADDCVMPEAPSMPDGTGATMEQMIAGQTAVKAFQAANIDYMACLEPEVSATEAQVEAATGDDKAAAKKAYDEKAALYNAAVSAEEEVAGQFNAAIRAYKAANPS